MSEIKKQWYVVRAIGGKEGKVKEYIEAEIRHNHLEDYISQVLIPTEKVYTIRNGKESLEREGFLSGLRAGGGCFRRSDSDASFAILPTCWVSSATPKRTAAR